MNEPSALIAEIQKMLAARGRTLDWLFEQVADDKQNVVVAQLPGRDHLPVTIETHGSVGIVVSAEDGRIIGNQVAGAGFFIYQGRHLERRQEFRATFFTEYLGAGKG